MSNTYRYLKQNRIQELRSRAHFMICTHLFSMPSGLRRPAESSQMP